MAGPDLSASEQKIANWLDRLLTAAIKGNFKEVRRFAGYIHTQAEEDKKNIQN